MTTYSKANAYPAHKCVTCPAMLGHRKGDQCSGCHRQLEIERNEVAMLAHVALGNESMARMFAETIESLKRGDE